MRLSVNLFICSATLLLLASSASSPALAADRFPIFNAHLCADSAAKNGAPRVLSFAPNASCPGNGYSAVHVVYERSNNVTGFNRLMLNVNDSFFNDKTSSSSTGGGGPPPGDGYYFAGYAEGYSSAEDILSYNWTTLGTIVPPEMDPAVLTWLEDNYKFISEKFAPGTPNWVTLSGQATFRIRRQLEGLADGINTAIKEKFPAAKFWTAFDMYLLQLTGTDIWDVELALQPATATSTTTTTTTSTSTTTTEPSTSTTTTSTTSSTTTSPSTTTTESSATTTTSKPPPALLQEQHEQQGRRIAEQESAAAAPAGSSTIYRDIADIDGDDEEGTRRPRRPITPGRRGRCSAFVKAWHDEKTGALRDVALAHTTWFTFSSMSINTQKLYNFETTVEVTSYPGFVWSSQDLYVTGHGLAVTETSYSNRNREIAAHNTVADQVFPAFIRYMTAAMWASNCKQWSTYFQLFHSGTYNNENICLDMKKVREVINTTADFPEGTLVVYDELPGDHGWEADMSHVLNKGAASSTFSAFPSYNVAYSSSVRDLDGTTALMDKYGDSFSHWSCPRAKAFRERLSAGIPSSVAEAKDLIRDNKWKSDDASKIPACDGCFPKNSGRSPSCAIASRYDIVKEQFEAAGGAYELGNLSTRLRSSYEISTYGALDGKVVTFSQFAFNNSPALLPNSSNVVLNGSLNIVVGPTVTTDTPAFSWPSFEAWVKANPGANISESDLRRLGAYEGAYDFGWVQITTPLNRHAVNHFPLTVPEEETDWAPIIIGIVFGTLGLIAIVGVLWYWWRNRNRRGARSAYRAEYSPHAADTDGAGSYDYLK